MSCTALYSELLLSWHKWLMQCPKQFLLLQWGNTLFTSRTMRHCWSSENSGVFYPSVMTYEILVLVTAQINHLVVKAVPQHHASVKYNWQLTNQSTGEIWLLAKPWGWPTVFQPQPVKFLLFFFFLRRGNWTELVQLSCGCCSCNRLLTERWTHALLTSRQAELSLKLMREKKVTPKYNCRALTPKRLGRYVKWKLKKQKFWVSLVGFCAS